MRHSTNRAHFVPPYLLERLAQAGDGRFGAVAATARATLLTDPPLRERGGLPRRSPVETLAGSPAVPRRTISDAKSSENLPGTLVRGEGRPVVADVAVNEAYDGLGATHALFAQVYGWNSIDGAGMPLDATVHFGRDYDNAFWNGSRMVFGDGDGVVFGRFTKSLTVIGHELTHGVTQHTAALQYRGQSGALNESISDVFGVLVEQYHRRLATDSASWLIGAELFTDQVQGVAMRSMREPGTAYDDDVLGKDPQPGHMDGYVDTTDDDGGVHINSGIPNHAFYLVATAIGGFAWEAAGQIWFHTLTGGQLPANSDFARFAAATADTAERLFGAGSHERSAVVNGWDAVGITVPSRRVHAR